MNAQPQPAWVKDFNNKFTIGDFPDEFDNLEELSAGEVKDFIHSTIATERLKWQEEVRREIEKFEVTGNTESHKEFWIGYNSAVADIAIKLFPLTPPPQEETKVGPSPEEPE